MDEAQKYYNDLAFERLALFPRVDEITAILDEGARHFRLDWELAGIWARHLVHTFPKVFEHKYPELQFVNGDVLPIVSVDPADEEWEVYEVDYGGCAEFIDDDGHKMPEVPPMRAGRHKGRMRNMGIRYSINLFDEERWEKAKSRGNLPGIQLLQSKQKQAKRAHDVLTDWLWAFGNGEKGMPGFVNHPNIQVSVAPLNAGLTSRLPANKSADEMVRDFVTLVDLTASATLEQYHAADVWLPHSHIRTYRSTYFAGSGADRETVWERILATFKGDDSGQGKVTFKALFYADSTRRLDPRTVKGNPSLGPLTGSGSDTSGIAGNFMLACPPKNAEEAAFIRARPYTTRPPRQPDDFNTVFSTFSKIGGVKMLTPLAFHRLDFGTT